MSQPLTDFPLADADKCVKCALCLPHCPTYRDALDEGDSPRGRIALMQGFATGALEITPQLTGHLDRCLTCRACEAVCPAEVPYGKLIDAARVQLLRHGHKEGLMVRLFAVCMRHPLLLRWLHYALWLAQRLGLRRLASVSPSLRLLVKMLPPLATPQRWHSVNQPLNPDRQDLQLFLGCLARVTQPQVTNSSILVLNALGYSVRIPENQTCCGALDQHAGRVAQACALVLKNLDVFSANDAAPMLHTASGCGATLMEYPLLTNDPRAAAFSARSRDISSFIATSTRLHQIRFKPWNATLLVHSPCTLKNALKSDKAVAELLRCIPELKVETLPADTGCCGAAGSYLMNEPEIADRLVEHIVAVVEKARPAALVTSNIGCSLHLHAALERHCLEIPVLHPIEILARQLLEAARAPAV
ncbi:MAG: heterodisulfide reductase-related iron-sulfur binding cluster [Gammaproteobacteria bacterium]